MAKQPDGENMEEREKERELAEDKMGGVMEQAERKRERTDDCMK